ncbi:MAG: hypothetical protein RKO24_13755 [Candidatus Competibacter sp.]|nr:hypothetical protein [Candidatus Competibacter sp.]
MNKQEIMKKAHELARSIHRAAAEMGMEDSYAATFAACLKLVWTEAKGGEAAPRSAMAFRRAALATMTPAQKDRYNAAAANRWDSRKAA